MWLIVDDPDQPGRRRRVAVARTATGVWVGYDGGATLIGPRSGTAGGSDAAASHEIRAPMTGRVVQVGVKAGDGVTMGAPLVVLEAMKMEYRLGAPRDGVVDRVLCKAGDLVDLDAILVTLNP